MTARFITKWFKQMVKKLIKLKLAQMRPPVDKSAISRALISRRLALMITEMFRDRKRRKELSILIQRSLPAMQKLVRGYLGRKGTKKLAFLRRSIRDWCPIVFASEFLRTYLESSILMFPPKPPPVVSPPMKKPKSDYVRYFVPEEFKMSNIIPRDIFEEAVAKW
jgi:hypothetical protein